jgi:two-component system, NtrC family, response regulator
MNTNRILVVDDDSSLRSVMKMQLEEAGYQVALASDGTDAYDLLRDIRPQLVITDLKMPTSGLELLRRISTDDIQPTLIIITAFGTVETAVQAMKLGAYDYVTKPLDFEDLVRVVHRAMERQNLIEEVRHLRSAIDQRYGFEGIIGRAKGFLRVLDQAARVAQHESTVLIHGETGTGKELLARAIHQNSRRKTKPFITINCGAIPKDLVEAELFGYTRGSFTGAHTARQGKIEGADEGTLFLDEIGELPLDAQVKLLRVLQQGEISKIGASESTHVDVRVIAATHRNLQAMIEDGAFREDLYYRLAVVPLHLPPLRERKEDIPELVEHLFEAAKQRHGIADVQLAPSIMPYLVAYRWPGNVRELENVVERLLVLSPHKSIREEDLPENIRGVLPNSSSLHIDLPDEGISLEGVERELIMRALERFNGNQTHAAKYLDISRRTLIYRMEKYSLT